MLALDKNIEYIASIRVLKFYLAVCKQYLLTTVILVVVGFVSRVLSILQFVLVIKVFLSIFDPSLAANIIGMLVKVLGIDVVDLQHDFIIKSLFAVLGAIVCFQFFLARFHLSILCVFKENAVLDLLNLPLNKDAAQNIHLCIDQIQHGLEAIIRSGEIIIFYLVLMLVIFYFSPLLAVLVVIFVPPLFTLLVLKNRKEVHLQSQIVETRKASSPQGMNYPQILKLIREHYRLVRSSIINSEFGSGITLIVIMLVFFNYFDNMQLTALGTLMLVFSLRFAITYAGELSRFVNRILQLRTKLDLITEVNPEKPFA